MVATNTVDNRVYVIEHRLYNSTTKQLENVVCRLCSTREKAIEWCRQNLDFDRKEKTSPWWFYIYAEVVDEDAFSSSNVVIVGWDGKILNDVPIRGYDE